MYVSTLGLRSDQQTCEYAAKLDAKAAFASLSAFSFPGMPTCDCERFPSLYFYNNVTFTVIVKYFYLCIDIITFTVIVKYFYLCIDIITFTVIVKYFEVHGDCEIFFSLH